MGAMSSLVAATQTRPPVDGVVAVSPGLTFRGLNPQQAVPSLRVPVLYVVAAEDGDFPGHARTLHDATGSAVKRLVVVEGRSHGRSLVYGRDHAPVRELIEAFLREHTTS